MRRGVYLALTVGALALLVGCEQLFRALGQEDDEGLVGILFRDGTECLGEEAVPRPGEVLYVAPDGDDANPGTDPQAPLGTLASALCNLRPGQTLRVLPGTYRESVILGAFGGPQAPIVIQGVHEGGAWPVLDGEGARTMGIALVESVNVVIEGLEFRNYTDEGLYVLTGSDITVRGNRFLDNGRASIEPDFDGEGFGVHVSGTRRVTLEGNEAAGNGPGPERRRRAILGTGIDTFELREAVIRGNHSHDNLGGGILVEDGIEVLVEGNLVENNELDAAGDYWDGGIWVDGGRDVTLRDNVLRANHGPGLELSDEDHQAPRGYLVEGNTITGNLFGVYLWNFGRCPFPAPEVIRFVANVIQDNLERDLWCQEDVDADDEAAQTLDLDGDGRLSDEETLRAVGFWVRAEPLPGTSVVLDDGLILAVIRAWIRGATPPLAAAR